MKGKNSADSRVFLLFLLTDVLSVIFA